MFIKEIKISGYRNFKDVTIPLHEGINVIMGHNNSGKSNLLRAIGLVLGYSDGHKMTTSDLFYETDLEKLKEHSPCIKISLVLHINKDEKLYSHKLGLVRKITLQDKGVLADDFDALLNYEFKLDKSEENNYKHAVANAASPKDAWKIIDRDYIRLYHNSRFCGGNIFSGIKATGILDCIDYQFLDAIRDVSRDLYAGYNPLLKDVLNFFIDYSIKNNASIDDQEKDRLLQQKRQDFSDNAKPLMKDLQERLEDGKSIFLKYAYDTGATFNGSKPDFDGEITENEMFAALRMIIKDNFGIEIPATCNGLGYNNLIYMSLLLAKMQANSNIKYMKNNTKLMSLLAVEECEAHLHPAMQYKFLKFLQDNKANGYVDQIFITSHSPEIISSANLDYLICLSSIEPGKINVGYPRKIFNENVSDMESKKFIQKFMDATKADIFFANKIIFVEGIAEQLLLPVFAKYLNIDLTDEHILVVNLCGRNFGHFVKLFDDNKDFTIKKKIACITDRDPCRRVDNKPFQACYPYEFNLDPANYTYKHLAAQFLTEDESHPNIRFFTQDKTYGKTFEYDLMRENPSCELLLTPAISHADDIKAIMAYNEAEHDLEKMLNHSLLGKGNFKDIKSSIENSTWGDKEKREALLASIYLNSVSKADNALELRFALMDNLERPKETRQSFNVPKYIADALNWIVDKHPIKA